MKTLCMAALAALIAIGGPARAQPDPIVTRAQGYELRLMGGGLASGMRGLHAYPIFEFGIPRTEAVRRVTALRGAASAAGLSPACGRHPLAFARFGTLTLYFRADRFVGWSLASPRAARPIESEWGTGIGTPRDGIGSADDDPLVVRRTARGVEFDGDGMHGLLSGPGPRARVTALWSGATCRR
jgi:hypothetical protein